MNIEYAIIVKNKTRLETLVERFNTKSQPSSISNGLAVTFTTMKWKMIFSMTL